MTASTSAGDIELTSSEDMATTFRPLLSKEKALPTVASLRSTPVMFIFLQSSAHVSLSLEPAKSPAIIPSRTLGTRIFEQLGTLERRFRKMQVANSRALILLHVVVATRTC